MGANSIRDTIVTELTSMLNTLESDVATLKESKKSICAELDKYSYQETMVGKDLQELKLSFNSSIDQLSALYSGFKAIPEIQESTNLRKKDLSSTLTSEYDSLFASIAKIYKLNFQKSVLASELVKVQKQILDSQNEIQTLKDCYESSRNFIQNEEGFEYEIKSLTLRKEELEEELHGRSSPRLLSRTSKNKLQDLVSQMSDSEALSEIDKISKRNAYLEDFIKYQASSTSHNIGFALGSQEKTEKVIKEYNSMIKDKKLKIAQLEQELDSVKDEINQVQAMIMGKITNDQRMEMLNEIIQKCRNSIQRGNKAQLKKLLRKKTFLENIEKTLEKVRQVE